MYFKVRLLEYRYVTQDSHFTVTIRTCFAGNDGINRTRSASIRKTHPHGKRCLTFLITFPCAAGQNCLINGLMPRYPKFFSRTKNKFYFTLQEKLSNKT